MTGKPEMRTAVIVPYGAGRTFNLKQTLASVACLAEIETVPTIVIVADGPDAAAEVEDIYSEIVGYFQDCPGLDFGVVKLPKKHEPGDIQPRNVGVHSVEQIAKHVTHVWFLDSDVILEPGALKAFREAYEAVEDDPRDRILLGPYEWLPRNVITPRPDIKNDPRWPSFDRHDPDEVVEGDLSAGLACFSGNLVWPIGEFRIVGGFWQEIHHGRCEDGELGLRAVAMGVPISFVRDARGYHIEHPRNTAWTAKANKRDVPMLNNRHPWVQGSGLFVVEEDGARFNVRCKCGWEGNTALIWQHEEHDCPLSYKLSIKPQA